MRLKIAPVLASNLLRLADAYFAAVRPKIKTVSMQSISRSFHGDPPFFDNLRAGKSTCGLTTYDRIVAKFDESWPQGKRASFPKLVDPRHGPYRTPPKPKRKTSNGKVHHQKADRPKTARAAS